MSGCQDCVCIIFPPGCDMTTLGKVRKLLCLSRYVFTVNKEWSTEKESDIAGVLCAHNTVISVIAPNEVLDGDS